MFVKTVNVRSFFYCFPSFNVKLSFLLQLVQFILGYQNLKNACPKGGGVVVISPTLFALPSFCVNRYHPVSRDNQSTGGHKGLTRFCVIRVGWGGVGAGGIRLQCLMCMWTSTTSCMYSRLCYDEHMHLEVGLGTAHARLSPILDCSSPLFPVARSFSRRMPLPLSLHDCVPFSSTNSLHDSWKIKNGRIKDSSPERQTGFIFLATTSTKSNSSGNEFIRKYRKLTLWICKPCHSFKV